MSSWPRCTGCRVTEITEGRDQDQGTQERRADLVFFAEMLEQTLHHYQNHATLKPVSVVKALTSWLGACGPRRPGEEGEGAYLTEVRMTAQYGFLATRHSRGLVARAVCKTSPSTGARLRVLDARGGDSPKLQLPIRQAGKGSPDCSGRDGAASVMGCVVILDILKLSEYLEIPCRGREFTPCRLSFKSFLGRA